MFTINHTEHAMIQHKTDTLSIRIHTGNPDHHLYNNNGVWWIHYTEYPDALTSRRVRRSLRTRDRGTARRRRDAVFAGLFRKGGLA